MPSGSPSAAPIHACASYDLSSSIFSASTVFGNDQNGNEHFYTFASSSASWQIWDGTATTSLSESSRDGSSLSASHSDSSSGKSGQVSLLTTTNEASYLEVTDVNGLNFEMKIYLAEPGCSLPFSGNSCGETLSSSIMMGSAVFGEDSNGDEHHYTFQPSYASWKIWDGTSTLTLPESNRSPSGLRAYHSDFSTGKKGEVFLLSTADPASKFEMNIIDSLTFELKIYLSVSTCTIPTSGISCG